MAEGENTNDSAHSSKPAAHSAGGSGLSHRIGPLPLWGWIAVVVVGVIIWKVVRSRQAAQTQTASGTVGGANNALGLFGSEGFSTNSAGEVIDNATGDILGTFGGATSSTGSAGTGTYAGWAGAAQQALLNLGYDNNLVDTALQDYSAGQQLPQNEYNAIEAAIKLVGNPPSGIALPELQPPPAAPAPAPAAPAPAPPPVPTLPALNSNAYPLTVLFGQYAPGDYTQIGSVNNGQYSGYNVTGGAPVYANVYGGFVQGFNWSTLPNGTGIYVPTSVLPYVAGYPGNSKAA